MKSKSAKKPTVSVQAFYEQFGEALQLKLLAGESGLDRLIREPTVNRPGLALAGFTKYFANKRLQVLGSAETNFLKMLDQEVRDARFAHLFTYNVPAVVFSRNVNPHSSVLKVANEKGVPLFKTPQITMQFINKATLGLDMLFAPTGSVMGSMVDILGIGVIIKGESGIGKSESVLALIERGYSLVADDITRVTLVDGTDVVGTSSEITRNHMEVRGIGIINVEAMFGVKSIRSEKRVDLIVNLKSWHETPDVDRVGIDNAYEEILGTQIPQMTIPVRPGRDLARLIEVAAFQTKLKLSGYNAAEELNERLIARMAREQKPVIRPKHLSD